jgi:Ca-activated chloride channel homolog
VLVHNFDDTGAAVSAYAGAHPPVAEVPFVVLHDGNESDDESVDATAGSLRDALLSPKGQETLRAAGFRDRNGQLAATYQPVPPLAADRLPDWSAPPAAAVRSVVDSWAKLGRRGQVLVVVDSSGSMADTLPGSSVTKSRLAQRALARVAESIAPDSDIGLWTFTASPRRDYRVLVPLGAADGSLEGTSRRQVLLREIHHVRPVPFGGTGLYDTTLAAFREVSRTYTYGRLNAVLVITDGRNDDPGSISLRTLLRDLQREYDGIKPVRIIACAYGGGADIGILRRIADVTGGATFRAPTAADVSPLLQKALADL